MSSYQLSRTSCAVVLLLRYAVRVFFGALLSALPAHRGEAFDAGQQLEREFTKPYDGMICDVPVMEMPKFGCGFQYLTALPQFLEEREAARLERLEIEKARAWFWFAEPPTAESCGDIPELERAKFAYQCRPEGAGTDALGLLQLNLVRLQNKREALATRISVVRNDFERLKARQGPVTRLSPTEQAHIQEMEEVLSALDRAILKQSVLERFKFELQRNRNLDFSKLTMISFENVNAAVALTETPNTGSEEIGRVAPGDLVVVLDVEGADTDKLMIVHSEFGLAYADRADFFER